MKVLKTSIDEIDESIVAEAIRVMADGGVILYPTDTVYGLGANIFDNDAVKRVFDIKQRSHKTNACSRKNLGNDIDVGTDYS